MRLLDSEEFLKKYQELRTRHSSLKPFKAPCELRDFLHDQNNKDYQAKDSAFRALILEYQRAKDQLLSLYLIGLLMPGLNKIFYHFAGKANGLENDELWLQIFTYFLQHLENYNFERRPGKVAKNILMDTFGSVSKWLQHLRDYQKTQCSLENAMFLVEQITATNGDLLIEEEQIDITPEEFLLSLINQGIISFENAYIILATRIEGKTLKALAQELNQSYEALKKRRQRTLKIISKVAFKNELWKCNF